MPPLTQRGPTTPSASPVEEIDGLKAGSIVFCYFLSLITSRPEGQLPASSMAVFFAFGLFDFLVNSQIPPARSQKPAWTQSKVASLRINFGPTISSAFLLKS